MNLIKYGHASIALERDGRRLVVDPGGLTPEDALAGADAVLITHEHFDHFDPAKLGTAPEIWTNADVAKILDRENVHVVGEGDTFEAAGFEVRAYGQWHASLHRDIPRVRNVGFLVAGTVFHPGDALTVPDVPVPALMLPVHAPWSRIGDLIDWVREVKPQRTVGVHDGALNPVGRAMVDGFLGETSPAPTGASYEHLDAGATREI